MGRISIVMATYNGEKYLPVQLQSLLNQTRKPDEVVICDDRSRDRTVEIAKRFIAENRLDHWKILENTTNLGYVRNFQKAMRIATGDILFLCDQDDIWCAEKLSVMCAVMEKNQQMDALVCGYDVIDANGMQIVPQPRKFYVPPIGAGELTQVRGGKVLYANMAQGCAGAYRRSIVDSYCQAEQCSVIPHDWALHMLAYERGGLYYLNRELIHYRVHADNVTGISAPGRIATLQKEIRCMNDGMGLPISQSSKIEMERLTDFYRIRIHWLQTKRISVWISGWLQFFPLIIHHFFLQYMKDFVLVLLRRIDDA